MEAIAIGEDIHTRQEIFVSQDALYSGTYVIGVQGSGKTSILTNIGLNQMELGDSVIVLDPTGDMIRDIISRMPKERISDTYVFSLKEFKTPFTMSVFSYPEQTKGVKLLELQQGTRNQIYTAFEKLWPETKTGLYFKNMLHNSIPILLDHPRFTLNNLPDFFANDTFREQIISELTNRDIQLFWREFGTWSRSRKEQVTQPFLDRVNQLLRDEFIKFHICPKPKNTGGVGENDEEKQWGKRVIDIRQLILDRKIVLIHLPLYELPYKEAARTIGIFFMMQIYAATFSFASMDRDNRPGFTLLVDEFSKWATGSGDDFRDLFSFGRKYGIKQVLCHQYLDQLNEEGMGSLKQAMTSAHTVIALRTNRDDSPYLSHLFSGYEYDSDNAEGNREEVDEEEEYTRKPTIINVEPIAHLDTHPNSLVRDFYVRHVVPLRIGTKMTLITKSNNHRTWQDLPQYNFGFGRIVSFRPEDMQELLRRLNKLLYYTQVAEAIDEAELHTFVYETALPAIGPLPFDMVEDIEGLQKREILRQQIQEKRNALQYSRKINMPREKNVKELIAQMEARIEQAVMRSQASLKEGITRYPNIAWEQYIREYDLGSVSSDSSKTYYVVWRIDTMTKKWKGIELSFVKTDFTEYYALIQKAHMSIASVQKQWEKQEEEVQHLQQELDAIPTRKAVARTDILLQFEWTMRELLEALLTYPIAIDRAEVEREHAKWEKEQERKREEREKQKQEREANAHKVLSATDVAGILPKLENRHAFVKIASQVYHMKTSTLPAPVGWEENAERWSTILAQTKRTYCRGRKEVEHELAVAFTPQPDTNQIAPKNNQTPPTPQAGGNQKRPDTQSADKQHQAKDLFDRLDEHESSPDIQ